MAAWSASRVLSGSFAEIWVDGSRIAEASGIQMTIKMQRSDVQIGMDVDSKITGWRGEENPACSAPSAAAHCSAVLMPAPQ